MICDICRETQARFLLGNLETGEQIAYCAPDFSRFALDVAMAGLPPEEILQVLGIPAGGFANGEPEAAAGAGKRGKSKRPAPEPVETQGTAAGAPEVAPAPADE